MTICDIFCWFKKMWNCQQRCLNQSCHLLPCLLSCVWQAAILCPWINYSDVLFTIDTPASRWNVDSSSSYSLRITQQSYCCWMSNVYPENSAFVARVSESHDVAGMWQDAEPVATEFRYEMTWCQVLDRCTGCCSKQQKPSPSPNHVGRSFHLSVCQGERR